MALILCPAGHLTIAHKQSHGPAIIFEPSGPLSALVFTTVKLMNLDREVSAKR
jgi:hypothetical protein